MGLAHKLTGRAIINRFKQLPWWCSGKESTHQCRGHVSIVVQEDSTCQGATEPERSNY